MIFSWCLVFFLQSPTFCSSFFWGGTLRRCELRNAPFRSFVPLDGSSSGGGPSAPSRVEKAGGETGGPQRRLAMRIFLCVNQFGPYKSAFREQGL